MIVVNSSDCALNSSFPRKAGIQGGRVLGLAPWTPASAGVTITVGDLPGHFGLGTRILMRRASFARTLQGSDHHRNAFTVYEATTVSAVKGGAPPVFSGIIRQHLWLALRRPGLCHCLVNWPK